MIRRIIYTLVLVCSVVCAEAQVGEYRNVFSLGIGGGYALNTVTFQPTVTQTMHGGITGGIALRYTCEKYFSTICAVQMEVNYAQLGWKQDIKTIEGKDVVNPATGVKEEYSRDQNYVQIPLLAHLAWGKEQNGVCGFLNLGPQFGFSLSESTHKTYDTPYFGGDDTPGRVNVVSAQESMPIENTFDYGITAGAGVEYHRQGIGRFALEGRYYYGLGNIFGDSKRDYFGTSNHSTIYVKLTYMFDLNR